MPVELFDSSAVSRFKKCIAFPEVSDHPDAHHVTDRIYHVIDEAMRCVLNCCAHSDSQHEATRLVVRAPGFYCSSSVCPCNVPTCQTLIRNLMQIGRGSGKHY